MDAVTLNSVLALVLFGMQTRYLTLALPLLQSEFQAGLTFSWPWTQDCYKVYLICICGFFVATVVPFLFWGAVVQNSGTLWLWVLCPTLAALCYFDSASQFLPDELNAVATLVTGVLFFSGFEGFAGLPSVLMNLAFLSLLVFLMFIYAKIRNNDGMGLGDIKLLFWMSFWLPVAAMLWMFVLASLLALLIQGFERWVLMEKTTSRGEAFAFGPLLLIAFVWSVVAQN